MSEEIRIVVDRAEGGGETVDALDRGFQYGEGLFETLRTFGGAPRLLDAHLARLGRACATVGIALDEARVRGAVAEALRGTTDEAVVRVVVGRGPGPLGPDPEEASRATVVVTARPLGGTRTAPARLVTRQGHPSASGPARGLKATSYLGFALGRAEARAGGRDEVLFLDPSGLVLEAATANVFVVASGRVRTPGASAGILPGIFRALVLETAPALGIDAGEGPVTVHDLYAADEVFLTNAVRLVVPVGEVDGRAYPAPGPVTARLSEALERRLGVDRAGGKR